ncbi:hypothetical protein V8E53_009383 [Lactarius tabidus]
MSRITQVICIPVRGKPKANVRVITVIAAFSSASKRRIVVTPAGADEPGDFFPWVTRTKGISKVVKDNNKKYADPITSLGLTDGRAVKHHEDQGKDTNANINYILGEQQLKISLTMTAKGPACINGRATGYMREDTNHSNVKPTGSASSAAPGDVKVPSRSIPLNLLSRVNHPFIHNSTLRDSNYAKSEVFRKVSHGRICFSKIWGRPVSGVEAECGVRKARKATSVKNTHRSVIDSGRAEKKSPLEQQLVREIGRVGSEEEEYWRNPMSSFQSEHSAFCGHMSVFATPPPPTNWTFSPSSSVVQLNTMPVSIGDTCQYGASEAFIGGRGRGVEPATSCHLNGGHVTLVEEVVNSPHVLVQQGYLATWIHSKAKQYAHGTTPFKAASPLLICRLSRMSSLWHALRVLHLLLGVRLVVKRPGWTRRKRSSSRKEGHILFVTEWERTPEQEDVCDVLQEIARETDCNAEGNPATLPPINDTIPFSVPAVYSIFGKPSCNRGGEDVQELALSLKGDF